MKSTYIPIPDYKQSFEAVKYTGSNKDEIRAFLSVDQVAERPNDVLVKTSEFGFLVVSSGDFVIKNYEGQVAIWRADYMKQYMVAPIAVEAEFQKQIQAEQEKQERERVLRSGEALFK